MPETLRATFPDIVRELDRLCPVPPSHTGKPRQVFYIPFRDESIPGTTSLREQAEAERKVVMIRAFANALNREQTPREPEVDEAALAADAAPPRQDDPARDLSNSQDGADTVDNDGWEPVVDIAGYTEFPDTDNEPSLDFDLEESLEPYVQKFNRLDDNAQKRVLEAVANKRPTIVQHEGPGYNASSRQGFKPLPRDVINVMAHGRRDKDQIGSVAAKVDGRKMLGAAELIQRMKQDLGGGLTNIKLHICGSAGTFQGAFTAACKDTHSFPWATIRGYNKAELVEFTKDRNALLYLDRGSKTVREPGTLAAHGQAKSFADAARTELNDAIHTANQARDAIAIALQEKGLNPQSQEVQDLVEAAKLANAAYELKREAFDQAKTRFLAVESDMYAPAKANKVVVSVREALGTSRPAASTSTRHGLGR